MTNNQAKGSVTEQVFEQAATYYRNNGELAFYKTFPEFVVLGEANEGNVRGFFRDKATADYVLSVIVHDDLGRPYGQAVWIEIKGFYVKDLTTRKHKQGLHQFDQMKKAMTDGLAWGFYLTEWTSKRYDPVWVLYNVADLTREADHIPFGFANGHLVNSPLGWPEFLPAIFELMATDFDKVTASYGYRNRQNITNV